MGVYIEDVEDVGGELVPVGAVILNAIQRFAEDMAIARGVNYRNPDIGGIPYADYLRTPHWKKTRERALARAGRKCSRCEFDKSLEVHHLTYARRGNEAEEDLVVLCHRCHAVEHGIDLPILGQKARLR